MVWTASESWPTSSCRLPNCGRSVRALMLRLTFSALSERRRIGPAMVRASSIDAKIEADSANSTIVNMTLRSLLMISSISPGRVESSRAPSMALRRWIGTASDTIFS